MSGVYLDYGPTLPEAYGKDVLEAVVVSPEQVFVFWERTWDPPEGRTCRVILRNSPGGDVAVLEGVGKTGRHIFTVAPDRRYQAILGHGSGDALIVVQRSREVATPRATPASPAGSSHMRPVAP